MSAIRIMEILKGFVEGKQNADIFSFELPEALIEYGPELEQANLEMYELLNDELPDICSYYEPNAEERSSRPEYLNENEFKEKVKEIYYKAINLI